MDDAPLFSVKPSQPAATPGKLEAVQAEQPTKSPKPAKPKESAEDRHARKVGIIESRLARGEFADVQTRVAHILNQHRTSRNSDEDLVLRFWQTFDAEHLRQDGIAFHDYGLLTPVISIIRARQTVQNTLGLFGPDDAVSEFRDERQQKRRKRQIAIKQILPIVQVFCDESGKSGKSDKYYIVGSVWVNDVDEQSYRIQQHLVKWRNDLSWQGEFHFADATDHKKHDYIEFVRRAKESAEYVGLKAVILPKEDVKKRPTDEAIFKLYRRLVVDGINHELETNRFSLPRNVAVWKDKDIGADSIHLSDLRDYLRENCPSQFNDIVTISMVPEDSKRQILLQLADVFTGSINRILNRLPETDRNHKDFIAEHALRVLGADPDNLNRDLQSDFVRLIWL